jgi:hypothetical protein
MNQQRMTAAEYREITANKKPLKYRNQKTVVDGRMFDSKKEADYYCDLKLQKQAGLIIDFLCQVDFLVHEGYYQGSEWIKPIYYRADFVVIVRNGILGDIGFKNPVRLQINEVKGKWTRTALDKRKMFEKKYPEYEFIEI